MSESSLILPKEKIPFMQFRLDRMNWDETLEWIHRVIIERKSVQHCVLNAYKIYLAHRDPTFHQIVTQCGMLQADGASVVFACRFLGLPSVPRITGVDLMGKLLSAANLHRYRVYFLGAKEEILRKMIDVIRRQYPDLTIAGYRNGYFPSTENDEVVNGIRESKADILFLGISSPKKEFWLSENMPHLNVPFCMGVGGSFDIIAGESRRAPAWVQHIGMEWFYRWAQEPRRMTRRYLLSNSYFLFLIVKEWLNMKKRGVGKHVDA